MKNATKKQSFEALVNKCKNVGEFYLQHPEQIHLLNSIVLEIQTLNEFKSELEYNIDKFKCLFEQSGKPKKWFLGETYTYSATYCLNAISLIYALANEVGYEFTQCKSGYYRLSAY